MKIISIDPGAVSGIIVAHYYENATDEPLEIASFAHYKSQLTFQEEPSPIVRNEYQQRQLTPLLEFIEDEQPDVVICENYIMYASQLGNYGMSFSVSEMIGVLERYCWMNKIPFIKPRASDLYKRREYNIKTDEYGEIKRVPKPKKFRDEITNRALKERGLLKAGRYNRTHMLVNGEWICMTDYKIGSKSDHSLMALKHIIYLFEITKRDIYKRIQEVEDAWTTEIE